jgi:isopenicillin N synthase-like dioxygenase
MPPASDIPVIDIAALAGSDAAACAEVARRIGQACREVGFFAITGHGVPEALIAATFSASASFFALPAEIKQGLARERLGGNRGYVGLGVESLDDRAAPDHKEAYNLVWSDGATPDPAIWPPLPDFQPTVQTQFDAMLAIGRRLHRAFAIDLDLDADWFADKLDRPMATLRLLHYPPPSQAQPDPFDQPDQPAERIGAGEHTDYGNVTLLATDGVAGLQVRRRDGSWMDVPALPGAFVCNIGDCLMRWTNDAYRSTPHRVVRPQTRRYSIALFVDPNPEAVVEALPSCVAEGTLPKYAPITAQAHLEQRFAATYRG